MRALLALGLALVLSLPAFAQMRGHGGPVRAIAISPDGKTAVTGSFDTTVIVWNLETETALQVLRFHEGPVNLVRMINSGLVLEGGRRELALMTGSDDGRVAIWRVGDSSPYWQRPRREATVLSGDLGQVGWHSPYYSVGYSDNTLSASSPSAGLDVGVEERVPYTPIAIAFLSREVVVATTDQRLIWPGTNRQISLPTNVNSLVVAPRDQIIAGGADGKVYFISADGASVRSIEVQEMPVTSLAISPDGTKFAVAGLRGAVAIYDRQSEKELVQLVGPGLPVWSLAFHPDGKTLLTGGADRMVRKWDITTGQPFAPANAPRPDFPAAVMNEKGAQVFRACEACHTVTPDGGNRAGPTLHGVFGRKIGSLASYTYSDGFNRHNITWTAETISRLFREGPSVVTPGTKMPEQKVTDPEDLKALVDWLEKVTR